MERECESSKPVSLDGDVNALERKLVAAQETWLTLSFTLRALKSSLLQLEWGSIKGDFSQSTAFAQMKQEIQRVYPALQSLRVRAFALAQDSAGTDLRAAELFREVYDEEMSLDHAFQRFPSLKSGTFYFRLYYSFSSLKPCTRAQLGRPSAASGCRDFYGFGLICLCWLAKAMVQFLSPVHSKNL